MQGARRGDRWVELAHGTRGRVARIGEHRLAGLVALGVEREEPLAVHVDFAADLEQIGPALAVQPVRNLADGAQIGGDVLAGLAVAARGALHEFAALVAQAGRKPVNLRLGGERQAFGVEAEKILHLLEKGADVLFVEGVVQRQHRLGMDDLGEGLRRRRADAAVGTVGADQFRETRLDLVVATAQRVVGCVGNLRRVFLVIELVVIGDLPGETFQLGFRRILGQVGDAARFGRGLALALGAAHARVAAISDSAAARAAAVTAEPESMRAISSRRCSASSRCAVVIVAPPRRDFSTRQ